jgi:uncharacterized protein (TIGR03437 family)
VSHLRPRLVCARTALACGILTLTCSQAFAQTPLNLSVSSERAPAGSSVQFKLYSSVPALIAGGAFTLDLDPNVFGAISDFTIFSSTGDAIGYVKVSGRHAEAHFSSPSAGIGQLPGLPIAVWTAPVVAGANAAVPIDQSLAKWLDPAGKSYSVTVAPGSFSAAGSLSIQSVTPGGYLPGGTPIRISGTGFDTSTNISIDGVATASPRVIDPRHIETSLAGATEMTGKHVTVTNSAGERQDFFCAIPSAPAPSPSPYPGIFPIVPLTLTQHTTGNSTIPSNGGVQNGLALMNQTLSPVTVTFLGTPFTGPSYSQVSVTVPPSTTHFLLLNTLSNDQVPPFSTSRYYITASTPIRMLGFSSKVGPVDSVSFGVPAEINDQPPPITISYVQDPSAWSWQIGTPMPPAASLAISTTLPYIVTSDVSWIRPTRSADQTLVLTPNLNGLTPGTYSGTVTLTPVLPPNDTGFQVQSTTVHVSLTVSAAPLLVSPVCCAFLSAGPTVPPNNNAPIPINSNGDQIPFTVTTSGEPWFKVDLNHGTTPATVTATTASTLDLLPGDYKGSISVRGPNNSLQFSVTLTVTGPPPPSGQLHVSPSSLQFVLESGTAGPLSSQTITTGVNGPVTFTARTLSGGDWLKTQSFGSSIFTVNVTAVNLGPGTYSAEIVASANGFTPVTVPVTLTVLAPPPPSTLRVSPTSIALTASTGVEQTAQIKIDSAGAPLLFQPTVSGVSGFMFFTVDSAYTSIDGKYTTPATLTIHATSSQPGTYRGAITFQATNNSVTVPVTFDVSPGPTRPPQISAVVNAASGLPAAIAPAEIVTLFGQGIGAPVDVHPTTLLINGTPATVIYASSGQVNAVVPRDVPTSGIAKVTTAVAGVTSAEWGIPLAPDAPGIFSLDGSGTGPAAVLNQDNSVNGPAIPAARGSVIQIFATGIPPADHPVKISIGGIDAAIQYQGPAPGLISGVSQVNVFVPAAAPSGPAVPLVIRSADRSSSPAVTIAVR